VAHTLTAADPKTRIEVTFEPNWDEIKTPSRCVYLIEPRGPSCKLTVEHYAIPAGHEGVAEGWARTLSGLKSYLETGQDMHFSPAAEATA
ncbi:MAG: SRPBCC domain-containing protein, partial [Pseudomonadota bacterium]